VSEFLPQGIFAGIFSSPAPTYLPERAPGSQKAGSAEGDPAAQLAALREQRTDLTVALGAATVGILLGAWLELGRGSR
jgi:hypothetical protein